MEIQTQLYGPEYPEALASRQLKEEIEEEIKWRTSSIGRCTTFVLGVSLACFFVAVSYFFIVWLDQATDSAMSNRNRPSLSDAALDKTRTRQKEFETSQACTENLLKFMELTDKMELNLTALHLDPQKFVDLQERNPVFNQTWNDYLEKCEGVSN